MFLLLYFVEGLKIFKSLNSFILYLKLEFMNRWNTRSPIYKKFVLTIRVKIKKKKMLKWCYSEHFVLIFFNFLFHLNAWISNYQSPNKKKKNRRLLLKRRDLNIIQTSNSSVNFCCCRGCRIVNTFSKIY